MRRTARVSAGLVSLALMTAVAGAAASTSTSGPECGDAVSGAVALARDLVCGPGTALTVDGDATIDLAGHRLAGPGADAGGIGIALTGPYELAVSNGSMEGWETGIAGFGPAADGGATASITVDGVTLAGNGVGVRGEPGNTVRVTASVLRNGFIGLSLFQADGTVAGSEFADNVMGLGVSLGRLSVVDTTFRGNDTGVGCDEAACDVSASLFEGNGLGLEAFLSAGSVTGNEFRDNDTGAAFSYRTVMDATGNIFDGNELALSTSAWDESTISDNTFRGNGHGNRPLCDDVGC